MLLLFSCPVVSDSLQPYWRHAAGQASQSLIISQSLPKFMSIKLVIPFNHLESPFNSQEIKPVNLKGNQPWIVIGRTDAEAEAPILWSLDSNSQLTGKVPVAGKDWRQKEKRATEDEMVGWHHWFNGLGQTPRDGDRTGKPGVLQSIGSQRVRHNLGTEHQQHIQNN